MNLIDKLNSNDIAVYVKTVDGVYEYINRAGAEMIGQVAKHVIGHNDFEVFDPSSAKFLLERDAKMMENDSMKQIEEVVRADSRWMRFHTAKRGVTINGRRSLIGISIRVEQKIDAHIVELMDSACAQIDSDPRKFASELIAMNLLAGNQVTYINELA